jgi:hypothetical protein
VLIIVAVALIVVSILLLTGNNTPSTQQPSASEAVTTSPTLPPAAASSKKSAEKTVEALPEVKAFMTNQQNTKPFVTTTDNSEETWSVNVGNVVTSTPGQNHTTTFNWYIVDKTTGKVKCSMYIYDTSGNFVRSADINEYPCN